jgi:hypothetical protein
VSGEKKLQHWLLTVARRCDVARVAQFVHIATARDIVHKLTDGAREAWVWVRQPPNDPIVRARTAFTTIKGREDIRGLRLLEDDLHGVLRNRQVVTDALPVLRDDAEALIYLLIADIASDHLISGEYHVYRGHLSSRGREILWAYKLATMRLIELGIYDQASYREGILMLRQQIKNAG